MSRPSWYFYTRPAWSRSRERTQTKLALSHSATTPFLPLSLSLPPAHDTFPFPTSPPSLSRGRRRRRRYPSSGCLQTHACAGVFATACSAVCPQSRRLSSTIGHVVALFFPRPDPQLPSPCSHPRPPLVAAVRPPPRPRRAPRQASHCPCSGTSAGSTPSSSTSSRSASSSPSTRERAITELQPRLIQVAEDDETPFKFRLIHQRGPMFTAAPRSMRG